MKTQNLFKIAVVILPPLYQGHNETGTLLITYKYTAWGDVTSLEHNDGYDTAASNNPFRYRGYYYDSDLTMYYLNSRYYDQVTGRFISPDTPEVTTVTPMSLTDKNLYAYCDNNPVMRRDDGGEFWHVFVGAGIGAAINATVSTITQLIDTGNVNWKEVGISASSGALSGALASTGIGALGSGIANAAINSTEYLMTQLVKGEEINKTELIVTMGIGAISGKGIDGYRLRGIYKRSNEVLATAKSATKIALYNSKIRDVKIKVAKKIGSEILSGMGAIGFEGIKHLYSNYFG